VKTKVAISGLILAMMLSVAPSAHAQAEKVKHDSFIRNKHFWIAMGFLGTAGLADMWSTQQAFGSAGGVEKNPIYCGFDCEPSPQRMVLIGAPIEFGLAYASYRMSKSPKRFVRRISWVPVAATVGTHLYFVVSNERIR
jgi:hypothetical protein